MEYPQFDETKERGIRFNLPDDLYLLGIIIIRYIKCCIVIAEGGKTQQIHIIKIMRRSAHFPSRDEPSWDTAPEEYITRHMRTERTPVVRAGRYQYPDAQTITKGKIIFDEDQIGHYGSSHQIPSVYYPGNHHHVPEAHKKVHFVEYQKTTEINNNGKQVHQEKIDIETEADIFIERKHKNFELAKMDTFMIN